MFSNEKSLFISKVNRFAKLRARKFDARNYDSWKHGKRLISLPR
jgi:hypothetical protein